MPEAQACKINRIEFYAGWRKSNENEATKKKGKQRIVLWVMGALLIGLLSIQDRTVGKAAEASQTESKKKSYGKWGVKRNIRPK